MPLASWIPAPALTFIKTLATDFYTLIYPTYDPATIDTRPLHRPFCQRCAAPIFTTLPGNPATLTCPNCAGRNWSLDWARSAYKEAGTIRSAIIQFKYNRQYHWKPWLVDWLEDAYRQYAAHIKWDGLVPVPLHPSRKAERTFNQAEVLAKSLCKRQLLPYFPCLHRHLPTPKQSLLHRAARLRNLRQALRLNPKFDVHGLNLLIIDDVFTTGATAEACAKVLKKNGASFVAILAVARA
jgi:ComF family protein